MRVTAVALAFIALTAPAGAATAIPAQELPAPGTLSKPAKPPIKVEINKAPPKPTPVTVTANCYTEPQYRAEQAIRYHTQLMVAGMLCQHSSPTSYSQYQAFTSRNQKIVTRAENVLIGWFMARKVPQPTLSIHTLRTNMANDISIKAMQQSLNIYCQKALPRLKEAAMLQPRQFETYLTKIDLRQPTTKPLCQGNAVRVATPPTAIKSPVSQAKPSLPSQAQK